MLAVITVSAVGVSLITGLLLPIVTGILTRPSASNGVKVVLGIVVAGVATLITGAVRDDGTAVLSWDMVVQFALIYGPQIAAYYGIWKPLQVDQKTGPGLPLG